MCHEPAPDPRFRGATTVVPHVRADDHAAAARSSPGGAPVPLRAWRHSRTASSEVSFGLLGRIVVTVLVLVLTWCSFRFSPVLGIITGFIVLPWALRDTWRRVRLHR